MRSGKVNYVMIIPNKFSEDLRRGESPGLQVLLDGTNSNAVWIYYRTGVNEINFRVTVGGGSQFDQIYTSPDSTTNHKLAIRYKQDDFNMAIDGVAETPDATIDLPLATPATRLDIGTTAFLTSRSYYGHISTVKYFNAGKADSFLESETA